MFNLHYFGILGSSVALRTSNNNESTSGKTDMAAIESTDIYQDPLFFLLVLQRVKFIQQSLALKDR